MFSNRFLLSSLLSLSTLGGLVALSPHAFAACPEPDPGLPTYVAARAPNDVCTAADLAVFKTTFEGDVTWTALEAAMKAQNPACSSCIFSKEEASVWGPIVKTGSNAFVNWGACYEKAAGGSLACGAAFSRFDYCTATRCTNGLQYCPTQNSLSACIDAVAEDEDSCGQYDYVTACPNLSAVQSACADLESVINVMCGDGSHGDAGPAPHVDGGMPDAGTADGGKKKKDDDASKKASSKKTSSSTTDDDKTDAAASESGCAQSGGSPGGSLAGALVLMCAVGGVILRTRRSRR